MKTRENRTRNENWSDWPQENIESYSTSKRSQIQEEHDKHKRKNYDVAAQRLGAEPVSFDEILRGVSNPREAIILGLIGRNWCYIHRLK
ncbi:hypothetical protein [Brucella intermedia]|uniref:hypothetical protein n=1 Tax=Brucella intermedia TaxID=94625 RepID=UPI00224A9B28|nr:hypothetical protein [Brucella intermedia]